MRDRQPIFVGDVQGCADELDELLRRAQARFGAAFELWIVGDLVNRGPYNLRPLRRVRALVEAGRCHYVLGNHELALLEIAAGLREPAPLDSIGDVLVAPDRDAWIEWLRARPLVVTGRLGGQDFALVHAAVHPDWDLPDLVEVARSAEARLGGGTWLEAKRFLAVDADRDVARGGLALLTRCRGVSPDGAWTSQPPRSGDRDSRPWHEVWAARGHGYGVVYGHWAVQGLHVAPWLRGLDTGCVHHGRGRFGSLTAWLPDPVRETPFDVPDGRFWRIPARRAYYAQRGAPSGVPAGVAKESD